MLDLPQRFPTIHSRPIETPGDERDLEPTLRRAVEELYDSIEGGRRTIDLVEAATVDDDRLADLWYGEMVEELVALWANYLEELRSTFGLAPLDDSRLVARFVITNCTFFARLRHSDQGATSYPDDRQVRQTTIRMIVGALLTSPTRAETEAAM
jgi:hypothetical protein